MLAQITIYFLFLLYTLIYYMLRLNINTSVYETESVVQEVWAIYGSFMDGSFCEGYRSDGRWRTVAWLYQRDRLSRKIPPCAHTR